jgi:CubicO group peptidase (beta-lactamase class C family)
VVTGERAASLLDTLVRPAMERDAVPGAAAVVVLGDRVLAARGYGVAHLEQDGPVDPDRTIFRIGSVTKVVTAVALLQLEERGRLRLDDDVNAHLARLRVAETFPEPIRLRHLLMHTGGLDEKLLRTAARPGPPETIEDYLIRELPPRVRPPGRMICYSNFGYTLLGAVIERESGLSFAEYLRREVFAPLAMESSWAGLPPAGTPLMATGYARRFGGTRAVPPVRLAIDPAAGMSATPADVGRLMIALLNGGAGPAGRILSAAGAAHLLERHFSQDPLLPGHAAAFDETLYFGRRMLYHAGGVRGYAALMVIDPEACLGIFVVNNGDSQRLSWRVVDPFLEAIFGRSPREAKPAPDLARRAAPALGAYRFLRHAVTSIERLSLLRAPTFVVRVTADGFLDIGGTRFQEIADGVFEQVGSYERAAFIFDGNRGVTHIAIDQDVLERVAWHQRGEVHQILLLGDVGLLLAAFWRRRGPLVWDPEPGGRQAALGPVALPPRWAERFRGPDGTARLLKFIAGIDLALLGALALAMTAYGPGTLWAGVPWPMRIVLTLPWIAAIASVALPFVLWSAWRHPGWTGSQRFRATLVAAGAAGFLLFARAYNLLGP